MATLSRPPMTSLGASPGLELNDIRQLLHEAGASERDYLDTSLDERLRRAIKHWPLLAELQRSKARAQNADQPESGA